MQVINKININKGNLKSRSFFLLEMISLFLLYYFVQMIFVNVFVFATDEEDIMLGGKSIARGFLLYKDFLSQHMPVSYYIGSIFELLGAHSLYQHRMYFYFFFALVWVIIYFNYKNDDNRIALALYPLVFLSIASTYDMGNTILSEHIAGVGFVVLVLEYINFSSFSKLKWKNCVLLSISLLLTFGTIFVGAFGVAVISLGVLIKEIRYLITNREPSKIKAEAIGLSKLAGAVSFPWIIYIIYLKINKCLYYFYYSAYEMNRTIYSKYTGLGEDIWNTVWNSIATFVNNCTEFLLPKEGADIYFIARLLLVLSMFAYLTYVYVKISKVDSMILFLLLIYTGGVRGVFNYHGTHCVEIICLFASLFLFDKFLHLTQKKCIYGLYVLFLLMFWLEAPLLTKIGNLGTIDTNVYGNVESEILRDITKEDEAIWNCAMWNDLFMMADRVTLYGIAGTAWMYEAHADRVLDDFADNPPRIMVLDRNVEIWGYSLKDYGKELLKYVDDYYVPIYNDLIYVRKDMVDSIPEDPRLNINPNN